MADAKTDLRTFSGSTTINVARVLWAAMQPETGMNGEDIYVVHFDNKDELRVNDPEIIVAIREYIENRN